MKISHILKKAILSEKAYKLMETGVYSFMVDSRSKKAEIKKFVAGQFGVKVAKVNLANFSAKSKRIGNSRKTTLVGGGRKAIVFLEKGQTIPLLSPKTEAKKESKKNDKSKNKEGQKK